MANTYPVTVIKPFDQREIDAIAAPFVDLGNTIQGEREALTAKQKAIRNREATTRQRAYKGLDSIESVDYATYDSNMRKFFDGKVDDYVTIANGIDAGTINAKEGARSLSYISNMIDEYQTLAPKVLGQAKFMMEHGAGGSNTLSKLNDPNLEIMFSKLLEGSGEVTLAEDGNGKMYLKGAGKLDGQDWSYNLNLSEFDKLDAEGDSLAITTINNDELGLQTVSETAAATAIMNEAKANGTTMEYTNIDTMRKNLMSGFSPAVDELINNPEFNAYWADVMYKDKDVDYLTDNDMLWDPADEKKMGQAKEYLIKEMINQIPKEQQIQFSERTEDGFKPTSKLVGVDGSSTWGKKALVPPPSKPDSLTVAETRIAKQKELFDNVFSFGENSEMLKDPDELLKFVKQFQTTFNIDMDKNALGIMTSKADKIKELEEYEAAGIITDANKTTLEALRKTKGKGVFVVGEDDKVLTSSESIQTILEQTFIDVSPNEIQKMVAMLTKPSLPK